MKTILPISRCPKPPMEVSISSIFAERPILSATCQLLQITPPPLTPVVDCTTLPSMSRLMPVSEDSEVP